MTPEDAPTKPSKLSISKTRKANKKSESSHSNFPKRSEITSSQSTMTQAFPTCSEMRKKREASGTLREKLKEKEQLTYIHTKPHAFDPRNAVVHKSIRGIKRMEQRPHGPETGNGVG